MPDYYTLLGQKIREAQNDPARLRELVCETARLALKRHVNVNYPAVSVQDGKRQIGELEAAIARLEADTGGAARHPSPAEDTTTSIFAPRPNPPTPGAASPEFEFRATYDETSDASGGPPDRKPDETPPAQRASDPAAFTGPGDATPATAAAPARDQPTVAAGGDVDTGPDRPSRPSRRFAGGGGQTRPAFAPRTRVRAAPDRSPDRGAPGNRGEDRDPVRPQVGPPLAAQLAQDEGAPRDWPQDGPDNGPGSRELVLVPDHSVPANRGATYLVRPGPIPARQDEYYRDPPKPQGAPVRAILIGVGIAIASQLAVVILAGAAFYIANRPMWGRGTPPADQDFAAATPRLPAKAPPLVRAAASPELAAERADAATFGSAATVGGAPAAFAPTAVAAAPAFPRPTAYGVYAISDNRLIELEQIATAPVDPRARGSLQIVKPSQTVITDPKLSFVAYRRDLTTSAPDKVPVRIAARIARAMTFDASGKAVTAPPQTETWLIRDQGYDLRVSPVRESSEMVLLRPASEEFAFPPGRYELTMGGQSYDFVIAGTITDPAQCVEGVATARGPAFYECRTP